MESAGLLQSKRAGRESIFQLEQKRLEEARRYLGVISTHWDDVLTRLRSFVEE
jgi:DNA-binding transcriptional regulator PaaX